jgi:beta-lactamase regulating signal transducer with metallopeptidase domain
MTAAAAEHFAHLLAVQSVQLAAVVAAVALLVATLLRRRPHLAYALWLVALAKCLVPPVWSSPTGLFSWAAARTVASPSRATTCDSSSSGPDSFARSAMTSAPRTTVRHNARTDVRGQG